MEGMEGPRPRTVALLVAASVALCSLTAAGCGSDSQAVETRDPAVTFAPVVELSPSEPWYPGGARWFVERSVLSFATDHGCPDFRVAVGRTLKERHNDVTDWIWLHWLGKNRPGYERYPSTPDCEIGQGHEYYTIEHTRPYDSADRPPSLPRTEGWYIDIVDSARPGPRATRRDGGRVLLDGVPAYVERTPERVGGEAGLRLTYWFFYGMNQPAAGREGRHEGDWERVDVLLAQGDSDTSYEPRAVRLHPPDGAREVPWDAVVREPGGSSKGEETHPVLVAARGSHELSTRVPARACGNCPRWLTWERLRDLRAQLWYGFGGAWGEVGASGATTGPLGPHGEWPKGDARYRYE